MTQFITFTLRAYRKCLADFQLDLSSNVSEKAAELIAALREREDIKNAVHQLVMAILSDDLVLESHSRSPGYFFIIFQNFTLSGQIGTLENIDATLSELKWPMRASTFWQILIEIKEATAMDQQLDTTQ